MARDVLLGTMHYLRTIFEKSGDSEDMALIDRRVKIAQPFEGYTPSWHEVDNRSSEFSRLEQQNDVDEEEKKKIGKKGE